MLGGENRLGNLLKRVAPGIFVTLTVESTNKVDSFHRDLINGHISAIIPHTAEQIEHQNETIA